MVKLIKKADKPTMKTTLWCIENKNGTDEKRKQFTLYGTTLSEIEEILMEKFRER